MSPAVALSTVKHLRRQFHWWREIRRLSRQLPVQAAPARSVSAPVRRLLLLPCDPWTLAGSKGDEAMIAAVIARFRQRQPELHVGAFVANDLAAQTARRLGFEPLAAWDVDLGASLQAIERFAPDAVVVLGADVMDGYYSPVTPARLLLLAQAVAVQGIKVSLLGFSFNRQPNGLLRPLFDALNPRVSVNVRDPSSLERFQAFCKAPARGVADAAFLLEPDGAAPGVRAALQWAQARRAVGDRVVGFNLHPMLIRNARPEEVEALVSSAAQAIDAVSARRPVSWMLVSHDYRDQDGDAVCLRPLFERLTGALGPRLHFPEDRLSAANLKALAGGLDGTLSGRMHLAIASLGMGKPVAAFTYQDKFEGLFRHFQLPSHLMLTPADAMRPQSMEALIERFLGELPALTRQVQSRLPGVMAAAELNLA